VSRIKISETQFAFAFFHKYLLLEKMPYERFVFPTLRQEGDAGGEYGGVDLKVGKNLFFQFKMPEFLRTKRAIEFGLIGDDSFTPFYRMEIKNSPNSHQFDTLKRVANDPFNRVKYIAPMFDQHKDHDDEDAFDTFFRRSPADSMNHICSIDVEQFVRPIARTIDPNDKHKICYSFDSVTFEQKGYLFSEPKPIKIEKGPGEFVNQRLKLSDTISKLKTIEDTINEIRLIFFEGEQNFANNDILGVQLELISRYDVFWLPVLVNPAEMRKHKAQINM
jgi:hypothetical protein